MLKEEDLSGRGRDSYFHRDLRDCLLEVAKLMVRDSNLYSGKQLTNYIICAFHLINLNWMKISWAVSLYLLDDAWWKTSSRKRFIAPFLSVSISLSISPGSSEGVLWENICHFSITRQNPVCKAVEKAFACLSMCPQNLFSTTVRPMQGKTEIFQFLLAEKNFVSLLWLMMSTPSNSRIIVIRFHCSLIESQSIRNLKIMTKLVNHLLRPMRPKIH